MVVLPEPGGPTMPNVLPSSDFEADVVQDQLGAPRRR